MVSAEPPAFSIAALAVLVNAFTLTSTLASQFTSTLKF